MYSRSAEAAGEEERRKLDLLIPSDGPEVVRWGNRCWGGTPTEGDRERPGDKPRDLEEVAEDSDTALFRRPLL